MQQIISLKLLPSEAEDHLSLLNQISKTTGYRLESITGYYPIKKSIDARSKSIYVNLTVVAFIDEPFYTRPLQDFVFKDVSQSENKVIIVGSGPAGLFAALQLVELGIQPIVLERGKDVKARRRDLAALNKTGVVNEESNYCFGEGGAGTYSDGKLYTRSNKRGDIDRCLHLFVRFGADEKILYESHPHIGTNKLPQIITGIREHLIACGAQFLFEKKLIDCTIKNNEIKTVITADGDQISARAVILATGHSARDVFQLLYNKNILIESKPFALGVRIEHPQTLIDSIQYHLPADANENLRDSLRLPPAAYSLVEQVGEKGVFSFCMCPGGIIAPAATSANELVVNGWSPSKRNNPYSNSGMVVSVEVKDTIPVSKYDLQFQAVLAENGIDSSDLTSAHPLQLMYFQQAVERNAYAAGGGEMVAPAQRMVDFCNNKVSGSLPACSYLPGVHSASLKAALPRFVYNSLQQGFKAFGKKMKGYYTNEAVVVATESRTSSPVRIPRNKENLQHPQIKNLYPCGEGAGYAGGIISAAMDGEKTARMIAAAFKSFM